MSGRLIRRCDLIWSAEKRKPIKDAKTRLRPRLFRCHQNRRVGSNAQQPNHSGAQILGPSRPGNCGGRLADAPGQFFGPFAELERALLGVPCPSAGGAEPERVAGRRPNSAAERAFDGLLAV